METAIAKAGHNRILLNVLLLIRNLMREWIRSTVPIEGVSDICTGTTQEYFPRSRQEE
jgi:hypothetical protein